MAIEFRPPPVLKPLPGEPAMRVSSIDASGKRIATTKVREGVPMKGALPTPPNSHLVVSRLDGAGKLQSRGTAKAGTKHVDVDRIAPPRKKRSFFLPKPSKPVGIVGDYKTPYELGLRGHSIERQGNPLRTRRVKM